MTSATNGTASPIKAVAFDIDGTLYPDISLYVRIIPYFVRNLKFFLHYNQVRRILHRTAPLGDFFEYQARLLAERMHIPAAEAKELIDRTVYHGMTRYFDRIKPFPHVLETFQRLKDAGYQLAILSDFPPGQKGTIWGTAKYCDVIMGSEETGALKPSLYPFGRMAQKLRLKPEEILYVGNSKRSDIMGAKNAGMMAAYKEPLWRAILHIPYRPADLSFYNYRTLQNFVLSSKHSSGSPGEHAGGQNAE